MSDADFLLQVLSDGEWHSRDAILAESMRVRGCGLTVHSRAADLRKRGHVIQVSLQRDERGRTPSFYRLVALEEAVGGHGGRGEPGTPPVRGVETPVAASSSAPSPAVPLGEPPSREGALQTLFDTPRGAYGD